MPGEERALYSCQEGFRGVGRPEINCVQDIWEKVHSITPSIMFTIIISSIIVILQKSALLNVQRADLL